MFCSSLPIILGRHGRFLLFFLHALAGPTETCGWELKYLLQYSDAL